MSNEKDEARLKLMEFSNFTVSKCTRAFLNNKAKSSQARGTRRFKPALLTSKRQPALLTSKRQPLVLKTMNDKCRQGR